MDFNRNWTQFSIDAEIDHFGSKRICEAHNKTVNALRAYRVLKSAVDAMMAPLGYNGTISARDDRVQAVMDALAQVDEVDK